MEHEVQFYGLCTERNRITISVQFLTFYKVLIMNEKPTVSRKVRYTKRILQESLIELMQKKSLLNISVKEICEIADVGRTTFYTHYKDQYELLTEIEEQIFIDTDKIAQKYHGQKNVKFNKQEITEFMRNLLEYISSNRNSIQVLLSENGERDFQIRFFRKRLDRLPKIKKILEHKSQSINAISYYSIFIAGGFITLVKEWIKNGLDIGVTEMANMLAGIYIRLLMDITS